MRVASRMPPAFASLMLVSSARSPPRAEDSRAGQLAQLALQAVERRVDRRTGRPLAGREPRTDLVERERVVPEHARVLLEIGERTLGSLPVVVDWRSLAEPRYGSV